jgi:hypothetical protein
MLFAPTAKPQGLKAGLILRVIVGDESPTYQPVPILLHSRAGDESPTYQPVQILLHSRVGPPDLPSLTHPRRAYFSNRAGIGSIRSKNRV